MSDNHDSPPEEAHDHSGPICLLCAKARRVSDQHVSAGLPHHHGGQLRIDYALSALIHCGRCGEERPKSIAMRDWARLNVGFTERGIQIWCVRHDINVMHIDFQDQTHPATSMARPPKTPPPPPLVTGGFEGPMTEAEVREHALALEHHSEAAGQDDGALLQLHRVATRCLHALLAEQAAHQGSVRGRAAAIWGIDGAKRLEAMQRRLAHMPMVPLARANLAEHQLFLMAPVFVGRSAYEETTLRLQRAACEAQGIATALLRMLEEVLAVPGVEGAP